MTTAGTTNLQQSPFIQLQRNFPVDNMQALGITLDQSYIDIASKINARTIGRYSLNNPSVTGESWFFNGQAQKQQTLRQIYSITSYTNFNHNIPINNISTFTQIRGIGYDGTNWFPIPFVNATLVAGQVEIYATPTQVVFVAGGSAPTIVSGFILLEWLSPV